MIAKSYIIGISENKNKAEIRQRSMYASFWMFFIWKNCTLLLKKVEKINNAICAPNLSSTLQVPSSVLPHSSP